MPTNSTIGRRKGANRQRPALGYARGEETRLRIIRAAVELFGRKSFDRVSTREIASRARVNAPTLQYYFDGKRGLYSACVDYMDSTTANLLRPVIETVHKRLEANVSLSSLIDSVCYLYEQAAGFLLARSEIDAWTRLAVWDAVEDSAPMSKSRVCCGETPREFRRLINELVGRIIGKSPRDEQTRIRVVTLGSQVSVFFHARRKTLDDIGWTEIDERGLRLLRAVVRQQTEAALCAAATKQSTMKELSLIG